ncbi:MAG: site-2 protease family protein, partial [Oscillospiraceae bacterium]|nr:site-2 protease family protein [Oscillospiraceae bacterium]
STARLVQLSIVDLITGKFGINEISGPIGTINIIAEAATEAAKGNGFGLALQIMAFITINVGIFNLLPVPALDGGRIFFLLIEGAMRKPLLPKYEKYVHAAGLVLLLAFMAVITFKDVFNIIKK